VVGRALSRSQRRDGDPLDIGPADESGADDDAEGTTREDDGPVTIDIDVEDEEPADEDHEADGDDGTDGDDDHHAEDGHGDGHGDHHEDA
jgi:hypothetical protein